MKTDDLIQQLASHLSAVRPLPPPAVRGSLWLALSLVYVAVVTVAYDLTGGTVWLSLGSGYVLQQIALVSIAGLAGTAALTSTIPGRDDRVAPVAFLALAVWLIIAWKDSELVGVAAQGGLRGWACLPLSLLLGFPPALALVFMLRRGVAFHPRLTAALGMAAALGLGNLALRLFNVGDVAPGMILAHAMAGVLALLLACLAGPYILGWESTRQQKAQRKIP